MLTCLCDAFYGEVAIATVEVLEKSGCEVVFPSGQTCCGQPPFNAGDQDSAAVMAEHMLAQFSIDIPLVAPSTSCAAMIRHGYGTLAVGGWRPAVENLPECYELCEFLVTKLGIQTWEGVIPPRTAVFHSACHARILDSASYPPQLLSGIEGLTLLEIEESEQCCGFGGAFSISHHSVSRDIGLQKLSCAIETGADTLISSDMGCLMHLDGLIKKNRLPLRTVHVAQILAESIA